MSGLFPQFRDLPVGAKFLVNYSGTPYVKVSETQAEYHIGLNEIKSPSGQMVALSPSEYVTPTDFEVRGG